MDAVEAAPYKNSLYDMNAPEATPYKNSLYIWMHQKLHLTRTHYKWMHLKLQNYKSASEYSFTLDAPEIVKF